MIPYCITLENFGSFRKERTFYFSAKPGLHFMQGLNEAEPRLQANGAGKTTIWKALCWAIHGKTPDGLKAGDVCNWDVPKGVVVTFSYFYEHNPTTIWTMRRTWGPNSWTLSHVAEEITDEEVYDLAKDPENPALGELRLAFTPFLHSVLMAQGEPMFLDLKREPQAELFSSVMQLDQWLELSNKASKRASEQDRITRSYESTIANLKGKLDGQVDHGAELRAWERQRKDKLADLNDQYNQIRNKHEASKEALEAAHIAEDEVRVVYKAAVGALLDAAAPDALYETAARLERRVGTLTGQHDALREHCKHLKNNDACTLCGQRIPDKEHERQQDHSAKQLAIVAAELDASDEELSAVRRKIKRAEESSRALEKDMQTKKQALADAEAAARRCQSDTTLLYRQLEAILDQEDDLKAQENPYAKLVLDADNERASIASQLREVQRKHDTSAELHSLYSMWVRGFKDVRLHQIAEALTELEIEVNSCVTALGLIDWELRFTVDRETKGGSIQRGFSVEVISPQNPKPVPWEAWSGGEKQRLRVAATMGLANLIRSRTGCNMPLEVWDEPSQGLSPQGVQDLLEALARRALVEQREIWVVDHTAHAFGDFAGGATIIKNPSGSTIRQH